MIINIMGLIYVIMITIHIKEDKLYVDKEVFEVRKQPKK